MSAYRNGMRVALRRHRVERGTVISAPSAGYPDLEGPVVVKWDNGFQVPYSIDEQDHLIVPVAVAQA